MSISHGLKTDEEMSQMTTFSLPAGANSRDGVAAEVMKNLHRRANHLRMSMVGKISPRPATALRAFLIAEQVAIAAATRSF
jgi:hypothetical protein